MRHPGLFLSRRRFLLASASASVAVAQERKRYRVVILGAGLAGLASAYELQNAGFAVTVLEAQTRPGGRVHTLRFSADLSIEAGAARIPSHHDLTQHYVRKMGLRLIPAAIEGKSNLHFIRGRRVMPSELGLADLRAKYIEPAVRAVQERGFDRDPLGALSEWDKPSLGDWLRRQGASDAEVELLTMGFGRDFGSAAWFLLYQLNLLGATQSFCIEGGNDRLPFELARRVQDIRYEQPVSAVQQLPGGGATVITRRGERIAADFVVSTIPCPVTGRIFDDARLSRAKLEAMRNQSYSHTAKVFLQTRTRFWLSQQLSGNVTTDLPIERLTPDTGGEVSGHGILTAYPIGRYANRLEGMSQEERTHAALQQARQIFPELAEQYEGATSKCWGTDPWQRGSFTVQTPGQLQYLGLLAKAEGCIHFAGEHTSRFTGWMQGAFESAQRVVAEIRRQAAA